jgi:hypothetical protein
MVVQKKENRVVYVVTNHFEIEFFGVVSQLVKKIVELKLKRA